MSLQILGRDKTPCHMTYRRVLQEMVDPQDFEAWISEYHSQGLREEQAIVLSLDGKTLRGTIPHGEIRGTHLLTVYVPQQGLVLVQAKVERRENEIVVAPHVLKQVNLSGAIVIGDAMHTQRETLRLIVEAGGDYIWFAKENQPRTHWAFIHEVCNLRQGVPLSKDFHMLSWVNKNHGRIEKRTILVCSLLNEYLDWPCVAQVFRLERTVWHNHYRGKTCQVVYGLTSLPAHKASPAKLLSLIRQYWALRVDCITGGM